MLRFYRFATYLLEVDWNTKKRRVNKERKYWEKQILTTVSIGWQVCTIPLNPYEQTNALVQLDGFIGHATRDFKEGENPECNLEQTFAVFYSMVTYYPQCNLDFFFH